MRRNGMGQKFLLLFLTAAMILNMYNLTVMAEAETPELMETAELSEAAEELEEPKVPEKLEVSREPEIPKTAGEPEEPEVSKKPEMPEAPGELEEPEKAEEPGKSEEPEKTEMPKASELSTMSENSLTVSGNVLTVNENSVADIAPVNESGAASCLSDAVLEKHIVRGPSPKGAVVNLFDYWQIEGKPEEEIIWDDDYKDGNTGEEIKVRLCNMGISQGHLLRFGQTKTDLTEEEKEIRNYGAWNMYSVGKPYQGIVQNTLGADGFPRLNFGAKQPDDKTFFGNYDEARLDEAYRTESLAYLFSATKQNSYKDVYKNVQGLFQMDQAGYYYYDSQKNFAEFDKANSRFILYDSPGVGTEADQASGSEGNFGEFFPFNKASEVFNTAYTKTDGEHPYALSYTEEEVMGNGTGKTEDPPSYLVQNGNASFLSCTYPALNHYIGMTLEVPFLQTEGGRLDNGSPMTFTFSGDDDVWIFIDGVLVADLGGIHDAYELSINFADGKVSIPSLGEAGKHTLLDSFVAAGRSGDGFSGDTFAGNTVHTLKMFYMERGHMASNLSLRFNVVVVDEQKSSSSGGGDLSGSDSGNDPEDLSAENFEEAPETQPDTKTVQAAYPAESEQRENAVGFPRTGDDSQIGWWAALSLISLLGIGAAVRNMGLVKGRGRKRG